MPSKFGRINEQFVLNKHQNLDNLKKKKKLNFNL